MSVSKRKHPPPNRSPKRMEAMATAIMACGPNAADDCSRPSETAELVIDMKVLAIAKGLPLLRTPSKLDSAKTALAAFKGVRPVEASRNPCPSLKAA